MSLLYPRTTVGTQKLDNLSNEYWIHYIDVLLSHSLVYLLYKSVFYFSGLEKEVNIIAF